jgi:uncharacterized protein
MNVNQINQALLSGEIHAHGVFPHLDALKQSPMVFSINFGLPSLPRQTGIILIRGPRQYGKSTWLENQLRDSIRANGKGSALYLNGDELRDRDELIETIRSTIALFRPDAALKRLFIDEITAVKDWQKALKRLADTGELRDILLVTTGSKAADLRRGIERLPGRKGTLGRTDYYFTPVSFSEFKRTCGAVLGAKTLPAYLLSGGCPAAAAQIAQTGEIPQFIVEMIRDWIYGECVASGRDRSSLLGVMESLIRYGATPCGQAKIARETGLSNNTVAAGYIELLMDLMCIGTAFAWDNERKIMVRRKPAKFHFINLLVALSWHPDNPRSISDFQSFPPMQQGVWLEWAVAQELWRRAAFRGDDFPELQKFWQGADHELDFVADESNFIEVKRGKVSAGDFAWFPRTFPKGRLTLINKDRFETSFCRGITLEDFLIEHE